MQRGESASEVNGRTDRGRDAYLAACTPERILALIAERDEAIEESDGFAKQLDVAATIYDEARAALAQAKVERDALVRLAQNVITATTPLVVLLNDAALLTTSDDVCLPCEEFGLGDHHAQTSDDWRET